MIWCELFVVAPEGTVRVRCSENVYIVLRRGFRVCIEIYVDAGRGWRVLGIRNARPGSAYTEGLRAVSVADLPHDELQLNGRAFPRYATQAATEDQGLPVWWDQAGVQQRG